MSGPRDPYIFALALAVAVAVALIIGVLVVSIAWPGMLPWAQKARLSAGEAHERAEGDEAAN